MGDENDITLTQISFPPRFSVEDISIQWHLRSSIV